MARLEDLTQGAVVRGIRPDEPVSVTLELKRLLALSEDPS